MSEQTTAVAIVRDISAAIRSEPMQRQLKASLPPSVSLDHFTAVTITAINQNPDLTLADRQSLYNAVVKASQEGLLPDGNDAVLNIYNTNIGTRDQPKWVKRVQYQRMVGGIIKQFAKAGIHAYAVSVYESEPLQLWNDEDGQHVRHEPKPFAKHRGERLGALAVAKLVTGRIIVETMNMEDLAKAKAASRSGDGARAPWQAWPERMEQKSVLHRLRKRVAVIDEQAAAELNRVDDEFDADDDVQAQLAEKPVQTAPNEPEKRPAALQAIVDQAQPGDAPQTASGDPGPMEGDII